MSEILEDAVGFLVRIDSEHIKRMGWKKGTKIFISKQQNEKFLYIEEMECEQKQ